MKTLTAVILAAIAVPAFAAPLTVRVGENYIFALDHGQPARSRKVEATAAPKRGEIKVGLRSFGGTMMTVSNNSRQGYTFHAELVGGDGAAVAARTCTLPPGNVPTLESWPQKAVAVRIGDFKPASGGRC